MNIIKSFGSFEEGFHEMCNTAPDIAYLFCSSTDDISIAQLNVFDVKHRILEMTMNDVPDITHPEYPACCGCNISAKEGSYKTSGSLSFGWQELVVKKPTGSTINYSFRVTYTPRNKFNPVLPEYMNELIDLGWKEKDENPDRDATQANAKK